MPGMFCRHNRLTANCPICSKELEASLPKAPPRARATGGGARTRTPARPGGGRGAGSRGGGLVTRRLARAADDGYRNPLVPGLRATADAERLAGALAAAAARLEPPGPLPEAAAEPDLEQATWRAFLTVLAGPETAAATSWGEEPELPADEARTVAAYRAWTQRAGSQSAAFTGEAGWTPERRFGRIFERLAFPGFGRAARFELLAALAAAGRYPLAADALHLTEDDATTLAAKRLLVSGDRLLLERRARELADACDVPLAALDRGLATWGTSGRHADLAAEPPAGIRAALALR
jgi:hypothetical protein